MGKLRDEVRQVLPLMLPGGTVTYVSILTGHHHAALCRGSPNPVSSGGSGTTSGNEVEGLWAPDDASIIRLCRAVDT